MSYASTVMCCDVVSEGIGRTCRWQKYWNSAIRSAVSENPTYRTKHEVDRTTGCGDMAIWYFSKMAAAAIMDFFEPEIAPYLQTIVIRQTSMAYSGTDDDMQWFVKLLNSTLYQRRQVNVRKRNRNSWIGHVKNKHLTNHNSATEREIAEE